MKYRYQGPVDTGATLKIDGEDVDVMLWRGRDVDLPAGHEYVNTLVALGHLVPAATAQDSSTRNVRPADDLVGNPTGEAAGDSTTHKKGGK